MTTKEPYLQEPPIAKVADVVFFVIGYLLIALTGLLTLVFAPESPAREGGVALLAAGVLASVGVITRLYNLELIALWPIITGLGAIIMWLVLRDAQIVGWTVGALIPHFARRLLVLSLIAQRARRLHDLGVEHGMV